VSVPLPTITPAGLAAEWERVEVLAICLQRSRVGKQPENELINRLEQLQHQVDEVRNSVESPWNRLPIQNLPPLAIDVLACIYASEAQPRIGWHYQELQPGTPQPYITPALIQLLLALDDAELHLLQQLVAGHGELKRLQLIESDADGAFVPLRPVRNGLARLQQWSHTQSVPPGAYPVRQRATWDDLVLPEDRERALREFMMWLRHRDTVVGHWGGMVVGGPLALFSGPTGTGKTFAASVIAGELDWPLFRVDLARLVSKYIGETEKNIGRLFDAAHGQEMVLQFDEVDALMSKRGEIKEARDRYANMEVSYLLARVEDHHGPCILTTNLRNQIDKAFSRRFQMIIEFPRPDEAARAKLWRRMLPPRAPLAEQFDFGFLANAVNLTGGNIRNAALHAAYLAAEDQRPIDFSHIAIAVYRELAKDRQQLKKNELGPLAAYLPAEVCPT
jgi:AAA+ superfamily predicted ATPase